MHSLHSLGKLINGFFFSFIILKVKFQVLSQFGETGLTVEWYKWGASQPTSIHLLLLTPRYSEEWQVINWSLAMICQAFKPQLVFLSLILLVFLLFNCFHCHCYFYSGKLCINFFQLVKACILKQRIRLVHQKTLFSPKFVAVSQFKFETKYTTFASNILFCHWELQSLN